MRVAILFVVAGLAWGQGPSSIPGASGGGGGAPTGAAGGSLSGTYPNPGIVLPTDSGNKVIATPADGSSGVSALRALVTADINAAFTGTCNSSTVLTGGGTCATVSSAFSGITSGTNTVAAMLVGTGGSLGVTGSGTISATGLTNHYFSGGFSGIGSTTFTPTHTLDVYDATASTGSTRMDIRDGASQAVPVLSFSTSAGASKGSIRFSATDTFQAVNAAGNASANITGLGFSIGAIAHFTQASPVAIWLDHAKETIYWLGSAYSGLAAIITANSANNQLLFCNDCTVTSPTDNTCTSGGTGALTARINGVWKCII